MSEQLSNTTNHSHTYVDINTNQIILQGIKVRLMQKWNTGRSQGKIKNIKYGCQMYVGRFFKCICVLLHLINSKNLIDHICHSMWWPQKGRIQYDSFLVEKLRSWSLEILWLIHLNVGDNPQCLCIVALHYLIYTVEQIFSCSRTHSISCKTIYSLVHWKLLQYFLMWTL